MHDANATVRIAHATDEGPRQLGRRTSNERLSPGFWAHRDAGAHEVANEFAAIDDQSDFALGTIVLGGPLANEFATSEAFGDAKQQLAVLFRDDQLQAARFSAF